MKTITALKSVTWDVDQLKDHLASLNKVDVEDITEEEVFALAYADCDDVNWNVDVKATWIDE